jgi:hypothetical protein
MASIGSSESSKRSCGVLASIAGASSLSGTNFPSVLVLFHSRSNEWKSSAELTGYRGHMHTPEPDMAGR